MEAPQSPAIPNVTGLVGVCALCGKVRADLELHSVINGVPQYLGQCCLKNARKTV
jgi:hypothetical protein